MDVTVGKLMAVQSVTSVYQECIELNLLADENWKKLLQLVTVNHRNNVTSIIAHPIT